ncbi:MAG TPA: bacteriohopanetetrol glucosamine biosynthesis glycosyltransferase HpnI, partial [Rhizomicrobium sp.]
ADESVHGSNAKVSNLINLMAAARHDVLVLSDADIGVSPDWLNVVMAALQAPGVGLVTCLYTGAAPRRANLWSRLSAMGNSYDFLPNVILGSLLGLADPCFGSTIALRRDLLEEIGGFAAFADYLADDYEIGRAVREKGYRIAIPAISVAHGCHERGFLELFRHELRWTRTIRLLNPYGHLGSIVTLPLPLAILGAVCLGFSGGLGLFGGLTLGAAIAGRLFLKWRIDAIFATDAGPAWLLPLRDLLSFAVFLTSLFGETVHWRGTRFAVQPSGAMTHS